MQIYWTLKSVPELSQLPTAERNRVWMGVYWNTFRHWQTWAGLAGLGACAALGSYVAGTFGYSAVGAAFGGGIGGFFSSQTSIYVARRYYKDDLLGKSHS